MFIELFLIQCFLHSFNLLDLFRSCSVVIICFKTEIFIKQILSVAQIDPSRAVPMLAELYVPAFRTLIFVPRLRVPEGVVAVADFFFNAPL